MKHPLQTDIHQSLFFLVIAYGTITTLFFSVENCQEVYDTLAVLAFRHLYGPVLGNLAGYAISGTNTSYCDHCSH